MMGAGGHRVATPPRQGVGGPVAARGLRLICFVTCLVVPARASTGDVSVSTDALLKVKPAVVIVMTKISGEVRVACPNGSPQRIVTDPIQEHGTGFLITTDGYLVTNAHVVQPYYKPNEPELRRALLRQAIEQACVPSGVPVARKRQMTDGLVLRLADTTEVAVKKSLTVVLPNREVFVADVKAYSPPLAERPGKRSAAGKGPVTESGKDVAILKIDARNLPTVPLGDSDRVQLGQPIHLLGFPGVVMYHDLLDQRSAVEASITSGQISSVKRDARGAPVIQTDAAASWGNSGGPAIDERGRVVGVLTFISLTSDDTQAIQGFNFLVPANIVREFARTAGADLDAPSPFNAVWYDAVDKFRRKDWAGAQAKLDAAARLVQNLPDVRRLQAEAEIRLLQDGRSPLPLMIGLAVAAVLALAGGVCWWGWRRRPRTVPTNARVPGVEAEILRRVVRVSAADLARALAQRRDLIPVDVREPAAYARSAVQAKGALRTSPAEIVEATSALAHEQAMVLYCNLPGEVASEEAARRLVAEGYSRIAVLTGGFAAWEAASLPLERTPRARGATSGVPAALPAPTGPGVARMDAQVDLPVGVKGSGPYFNARATRLGLSGLSLKGPETIPVGQRLRLTVFLARDSIELGGHVVANEADAGDGGRFVMEVVFEPLSDEQTTVLEGFILAQRTARCESSAGSA